MPYSETSFKTLYLNAQVFIFRWITGPATVAVVSYMTMESLLATPLEQLAYSYVFQCRCVTVISGG